MRGGEAAVMLWLRHALPHCLLEGFVRFCATHRVLERLGLLLCLHLHDRTPHSRHRYEHLHKWCGIPLKERWPLLIEVFFWNYCRGPGLPLWLHSGPEGLRHSSGICCSGNLCTRSVHGLPTIYHFSTQPFNTGPWINFYILPLSFSKLSY